jgi:hypothetical protein
VALQQEERRRPEDLVDDTVTVTGGRGSCAPSPTVAAAAEHRAPALSTAGRGSSRPDAAQVVGSPPVATPLPRTDWLASVPFNSGRGCS